MAARAAVAAATMAAGSSPEPEACEGRALAAAAAAPRWEGMAAVAASRVA